MIPPSPEAALHGAALLVSADRSSRDWDEAKWIRYTLTWPVDVLFEAAAAIVWMTSPLLETLPARTGAQVPGVADWLAVLNGIALTDDEAACRAMFAEMTNRERALALYCGAGLLLGVLQLDEASG